MNEHQYKFRKGLDLPIVGAPKPGPAESVDVRTVAVLGADYVGLKPRIAVEEGDMVAVGSPIMTHKDTPDVKVTSPVAGRVKAVNRGARRALISVEIQPMVGGEAPMDFSDLGDAETSTGLATKLAAAGLWTSFRTRPYSKVPDT
ncbi:MAG: NADH:ubiquinone reductase (Na(+)-transporting) subunit A, partial [Pseudomonadota bacterium]